MIISKNILKHTEVDNLRRLAAFVGVEDAEGMSPGKLAWAVFKKINEHHDTVHLPYDGKEY